MLECLCICDSACNNLDLIELYTAYKNNSIQANNLILTPDLVALNVVQKMHCKVLKVKGIRSVTISSPPWRLVTV